MGSGYTVTDLIGHLNRPYNQEHNKTYTPALLGSELVALRMTYADHDGINLKTKSADSLHDAFLLGGASLIVGKYGRSYRLDGVDGYIQVPYDSAFNLTGAFTVAAWVRPRVRPLTSAPVLGRGASGAFKLEAEATGSGHRFKGTMKTTTLATTPAVVSLEADFKVNRWTHLAMIYNPATSTLKLLQDKVEVSSVTRTGSPYSSSDDILIGTNGSGLFYEMDVKDFRFIPTALTTTQVATVFGSEHKKADGSDANVAKYVQAWHTAFWEQMDADLVFVRRQAYVPTADGVFLEQHGKPTRTVRQPGQSDPSLRVAIIADRRRLFGNVTVEDVIEVIGTIIGDTGTGNIRVTKHYRPDGGYEPAYFQVRMNTTFLLSRGFTNTQIPALLADLETRIGESCAAGVRVELVLQTGALWNSGALWNDGELWGS